jgi:hypothetical protein
MLFLIEVCSFGGAPAPLTTGMFDMPTLYANRRRRTGRLARAVALLACVFAGPLSAATIYSWTDADGVQHFSAMPPADREDYDIVSVNTASSLVTRIDGQAIEAEQRRGAIEPETLTAPDTSVTIIDPEIIERNCERARQNIFFINSRRRIVINDENGQPRRLDDEERAALMAKSQTYLDENCGGR